MIIEQIIRSVLGPGTGTKKPKGIISAEEKQQVWSKNLFWHMRRANNGLLVSVTGRMYHQDEKGTLRRVPAKLRGKAAVKRHRALRRRSNGL